MDSQKRLITVDDLYQLAAVEDPRISPDGRWIACVIKTIDAFENRYKRNIWLIPTVEGTPVQLTRSTKDFQPCWSPDSQKLAFVSNRDKKPQIYVLPVTSPGGEARQLTKMQNGATSPSWSPDGTSIAYLSSVNAAERADEDQGEKPSPPADPLDAKHRDERREHDETERWDPRVIRRMPYREGTAYLDDRHEQIYIIATDDEDAKPRRITHAETGYSAPYWTPDGNYLVTARSAYPERDIPYHWASIYRVRVADGHEERLTDDSHSNFDPLPSPDGQWIAYERSPKTSPAEHLSRLAIIPMAGGEPRDLNLELDRGPNAGLFCWSADSSTLYFSAASEGRAEIYRVSPVAGTVELVISGDFEATGLDIGPDDSIAYAAATAANPSELLYRPAGSTEARQVTQVNAAYLDQVTVQPVHELRYESENGQMIQGWYLLPPGYQDGEKYPLIVNIHGGPFAMWGPGTPSMWHEWQYHAASGYVVFFCNPRGSGGYGEAHQKALHAAWGDVAMPDVMAGVDLMLEKGFVDETRMAVTGGSYGGYLTAWIVGHTDRFAAAVAQRGVYNLVSFYGVTDIPWFIHDLFDVTPMQDVSFLWQHSPMAYADAINTPLLILHSENDFRVPISDGEQLFSAIKLRGGTVEFVRFPRDGHELSRSGEPKHRVSRLQHMVSWFDRYCKE